jgi:hypothetical protein
MINLFHNYFPIEHYRGLPLNSHPGAFGCARKFNFHEGIDLYGEDGQAVYAIRDGLVVDNLPFTGPVVNLGWWLPTDALLVKDSHGYWVYGEVKSDLQKGDRVIAGQQIAQITPVLSPEKHRKDIPGHSVSMLHLERYSPDYDPQSGWSSWDTRENRPEYLLDPTEDLIKILTFRGYQLLFLTK